MMMTMVVIIIIQFNSIQFNSIQFNSCLLMCGVDSKTACYRRSTTYRQTQTHCTLWLTSHYDTPRSEMSTPSSVLIVPAYKKHHHRVSPSHAIQFNLDLTYFISIHCRITPIRKSKLYMQPPSKQLPSIVIITLDRIQRFIERILSSTINIVNY